MYQPAYDLLEHADILDSIVHQELDERNGASSGAEMMPPWKEPWRGKSLLVMMLKRGEIKKEDLFKPPKEVTQLADKYGFKIAEKLWWKAVDEVLKDPENAFLPYKNYHMPNYRDVYSIWKDLVASLLGFRPVRTKDVKMSQQIEDEMIRIGKILQHVSAKKLRELAGKKGRLGDIRRIRGRYKIER